MKTEMEQLKENADREKARQTLSEIAEYMDSLLKRMREEHTLHMQSMKLEMATAFLLPLTALSPVPEYVTTLALLLFWFVIFRSWAIIYPKCNRASHEFDGCIRTLEILGMIDKGDKHRRKSKKYRESWVAAMWERAKMKSRQEAYA